MGHLRVYRQDIWATDADMVVITSNNVLKKNGELVMGAGLAKQAKDRHPSLPIIAGELVRKTMDPGGFYGFCYATSKIALLQTKYHYSKPSTVELVRRSLSMMASVTERNNLTYAMPLPGSGLGGLSMEESAAEVGRSLEPFLDRIVVCRQ